MRRQIVVLGLGRFGLSIAKELQERGQEVLGIDRGEEVVQIASSVLPHAVVADATDETALSQLGVGSFDVAIVAMGKEALASIMATMALKRVGVPRVIARAQSDLHAEVLRRVGADSVVYPEEDMGRELSHRFYSANMLDYIDLGPDHGIVKVSVPPSFVGRGAADLDLRNRFGLTLLAIQRAGEVIIIPQRSDQFRAGDAIVLLGKDEQIDALLSAG